MQPNNNLPSNPISGTGSSPSSSGMRPDIVNNIPLKAQDSPLTPVSEGDDLDKIMQDVSHDLKQGTKKPSKKSLFGFKLQTKAPKPAPPPRPAALPQSQPQLKAAQPKPAKQSSAPVLTITMTVIVTGVLIAAAYYAYK